MLVGAGRWRIRSAGENASSPWACAVVSVRRSRAARRVSSGYDIDPIFAHRRRGRKSPLNADRLKRLRCAHIISPVVPCIRAQ